MWILYVVIFQLRSVAVEATWLFACVPVVRVCGVRAVADSGHKIVFPPPWKMACYKRSFIWEPCKLRRRNLLFYKISHSHYSLLSLFFSKASVNWLAHRNYSQTRRGSIVWFRQSGRLRSCLLLLLLNFSAIADGWYRPCFGKENLVNYGFKFFELHLIINKITSVRTN